jgi:hypothetical protein
MYFLFGNKICPPLCQPTHNEAIGISDCDNPKRRTRKSSTPHAEIAISARGNDHFRTRNLKTQHVMFENSAGDNRKLREKSLHFRLISRAASKLQENPPEKSRQLEQKQKTGAAFGQNQ